MLIESTSYLDLQTVHNGTATFSVGRKKMDREGVIVPRIELRTSDWEDFGRPGRIAVNVRPARDDQ